LEVKRSNAMNFTAKTTLLTAALTLTIAVTQADAYVKTNLTVQPIAATADAQDLMLHADNQGSTFLYVEQQQGALLSVYDVTNPARIKLDASVQTGAHSSYNFVSAMGNSELIAFRDGSGSGVIDLRQATAPKLTTVAGTLPMATERLGNEGYLATSYQTVAAMAAPAAQPRSVQIVETTAEPRVVGTVASVTKQVARPETGTTFLLGENGITVVRQVAAERAYAQQLELWNTAN
jgi:hypothetical protein